MKMCNNNSLCHLLVALNVFTAAVLVHGKNSNSTFSYTRFGGVRQSSRSEEEDTVQLERMLRDLFGGLNASSFSQGRQWTERVGIPPRDGHNFTRNFKNNDLSLSARD